MSEIINEKYKKQIIFLLNNNWTGKNDMYFPVQNSINIERKHLFKLFNYKYFYYKKDTVNTKRAILFLFKTASGDNTSVIIFKDLSIIKINLETLDEYYHGSIFEISFTEESIVIYDSFMISGNKINYQQFTDRISEAEIMISNIINKDINLNLLHFSDDISVFKDITDYEEIFMLPAQLPILTGINFSFFKWKPTKKITFCLQVNEDKNDLFLLSSNFKKLVKFAKIDSQNSSGIKYINDIKKLENYKDNCIIEIIVNFPEGNMVIKKVNPDKIFPTSVRLIEKVLIIKQENILFEELF